MTHDRRCGLWTAVCAGVNESFWLFHRVVCCVVFFFTFRPPAPRALLWISHTRRLRSGHYVTWCSHTRSWPSPALQPSHPGVTFLTLSILSHTLPFSLSLALLVRHCRWLSLSLSVVKISLSLSRTLSATPKDGWQSYDFNKHLLFLWRSSFAQGLTRAIRFRCGLGVYVW